jgi:hypothetical protein
MDIANALRLELRRAVRRAWRGGVNAATAVNVDAQGHKTSVYSDGDITIVTRDGTTEVVRRRTRKDDA